MGKAKIIDLNIDAPGGPVPENAIILGRGMMPEEVIKWAYAGARHIVQKDGLAYEKEILLSEAMVSAPERFLADPAASILGIESAEAAVHNLRVVCSAGEKKKHVLGQFESFLRALTGARAIRDDALMVADELFTNGSKNAGPLNCDPQDLRPGTVEFQAVADGQRLAISVTDSFGELDPKMMLNKIDGCFQRGVADSINMGQGGAGIGSFMVYGASIGLYIGVQRGVKTVVCATLPLSLRLKETVNLPKNVHVVHV